MDMTDAFFRGFFSCGMRVRGSRPGCSQETCGVWSFFFRPGGVVGDEAPRPLPTLPLRVPRRASRCAAGMAAEGVFPVVSRAACRHDRPAREVADGDGHLLGPRARVARQEGEEDFLKHCRVRAEALGCVITLCLSGRIVQALGHLSR